MQAFISIFLRYLKNIFFTIVNCARRIFCCFRNKSKTDDEPYVIDSSNFVVVQQLQNNQNNTSPHLLSNHSSKSYGFSSQSLVNKLPNSNMARDEWNNDEWISDVKPSLNSQNNLPEPEPDYFKDMTPQLKKQKKFLIQSDNEQIESSTNKFGIDSSLINSNFDDNKFQHFGSLEDNNMNNVSNWEEENDISQELLNVRREQRQQRHHHQYQKHHRAGDYYQQ